MRSPRNANPNGADDDSTSDEKVRGNFARSRAARCSCGLLDPASGKIVEYKTPSAGGGPHTLVMTDDGSTIWFTMQSGNKVASLDTRTGAIREYPTSGGPYGLAPDKAGNVWFCRMGEHKLGKLDPGNGQLSELDTGRGSAPRRMATAPDGTLCRAEG